MDKADLQEATVIRSATSIFVVCMKQRTAFVNSWRFLFKDAYLAEDTAFIRCILENGEPQIDGRDGKMAVRVVNAGNRSIREKKIIALC